MRQNQDKFHTAKESDTHKFMLDQRGNQKAQAKKRRENNSRKDKVWHDNY